MDQGAKSNGGYVFRGDTRGADEIFSQGFKARRSSDDLYRHAKNNLDPPSNYVSTSKSFDRANEFADNVYVVRPRNGVDVNKTLGSRSPFPGEQEIAIRGGIGASDVRGVTISKQGLSLLNPKWVP